MTLFLWATTILLSNLVPSPQGMQCTCLSSKPKARIRHCICTSTGVIRNKTTFICDGTIDNASCINATIVCPNGLDCEIICSTDLHHHETQHNHCPSPTSGCCRAHIYCPTNHKCDIICHGDGCTRAHIHATNALDLTIVTNNNGSRHMSIFCPLRDDINCIFKGDHTLHNASIHTLRGFSNIYIEPTCESCSIHCGATGTEHNCTANTQATECIDDDSDLSTCLSDYTVNDRHLNKDLFVMKQCDPQMIAYFAVGIWLFIPVLIIIIAMLYHLTQSGSDSPQYLSVFASFINLADFYTDIIFCVFLFKQKTHLYMLSAAMICTALPHVISVGVCMLSIDKWSHHIYKIAYIKRHDSLVIALTVLIGFVPTIQLLSSKLFYASRLTLPICVAEHVRIQQFKFVNHNLLEDVPLLVIQILVLFGLNDVHCVLWITFLFSCLSILMGTAALIMNCRHCTHHAAEYRIKTYELDIKSRRIEARHYYCHRLLMQCLCHCLNTNGRIETVSVIPTVEGISCRIEIEYEQLDQINAIDAKFKDMADNETAAFDDFRRVLCKRLHIIEEEDVHFDVLFSRLDLDGLKGNITKLKGRNTVYIPLKRRSLDATNSKDLRQETIAKRLSLCSTADVIEEEMPLKRKSLLLESMRNARLRDDHDDTIQMTKQNEDEENAIRNGCIVKFSHIIQPKHPTNYEAQLISHSCD